MSYQEGQRLQGSDGKVYVVHGGAPVLESTVPTGPVLLGSPDPMRLKRDNRADDAAARQADAAARAAVAADRASRNDAAITPAHVREANANATIAELKAEDAKTKAAIANMAPNSNVHGDAYLKQFVPPQMREMVKAYANGDLGSRAGGMSASMLPIIQHAMNYDPKTSGVNFAAKVKMQQDLAGSQPNTLGGSLRAMDRMLQHGHEVLKSGAALDNFGPGILGSIGNAVRTNYEHHADDPTVRTYDQLVRNYGPEAQKAIAQTTGASPERIDRTDALHASLSQPSRIGVLQADAKQAYDAMQAGNDQYKRLMGHDVLDLMSPAGKAAYDEIMAGGFDAQGNALHPAPGWTPAAKLSGKGDGGNGNMPGGDNPPQAPDAGHVATGSTRSIHDPRLNSQLDAMINAGASKSMIDVVLKKQGYPAVSADDLAAAKQWMQQNPGKRYYGADATKPEDMTLLQRASGTDLAAGIAHTANAATGGLVGALAGPTGQGALDAMAANSPKMAMAGDLGGGVAGALGLEGLAAANAPAALAKYAPRIADTLYGGISGFNGARDGQGLQGALLGAGAGLAGNLVGTAATKGLGAVVGGIRNPSAQYLRQQGIPLTVGQALGGTAKKVEDALTSTPFIGNMVDARRLEGLRAFNQSAFDAAAAPGAQVTATGAAGVGQLRQGVQDAYRGALDPVHIDPTDPQFMADVATAQGAAQAIPNVQPSMPSDYAQSALTNRLSVMNPAGMTGRDFQEAYRGLGRDGRNRAASDYGHEIAGATRLGQDALGGALERQNPGAFDQFIEANAANRRMNVLAGALKNAGNQAEELVTPAQLNRADIQSTSRLDGQIDSSAGNRPFYDLAMHGQAVLPSKLSDSGTWTRALVGGGLTGALGGAGSMLDGAQGAEEGAGLGLGATLAMALGGTRGAQALATKALLDRPDIAVRFGDMLRHYAGLGGTVGTSAASALTAN